MGEILGKRKRRADLQIDEPTSSGSADNERLRLLLQKHFETKYEPLEYSPLPTTLEFDTGSQHSLESEPDWDGLSDADEYDVVQTVEHISNVSSEPVPKEELKTFMTSKPPLNRNGTEKVVHDKKQDSSDDPTTEASLLASDLALQRLLRESHLLDPSNVNLGSSLAPTGTARFKALDIRLQHLGAKGSLMQQKSMPMSHRRGIEQKKTKNETERRKEAREAGVILEREKKGVKVKEERDKSKPYRVPGVGRMVGGTLKLSKRDVAEIQGRSAQPRRMGKKRK